MQNHVDLVGCGSLVQKSTTNIPRQQIFPPWFCIQVHPYMEDLCLKHLKYQGFTTHMPLDAIQPELAPDGKRQLPPRPLFPGYLFCTFDEQRDPWYKILSTMGVKKLFRGNAGRPTRMPSPALVLLGLRPANPLPELAQIEAGDSITIISGPLSTLEGICKLSSGARVKVLLNILGSSQLLSIDRSSIRKSEKDPFV